MFVRIASFSPILVAAVHKSAAPALIADAVASAAAAYASNKGAANLVNAVADACRTTDKGKTRTPAAGTAAALILASMEAIVARAESVGAWPHVAKASGIDVAERQRRSDEFGATIRAEFVAAGDAVAAARATLSEARKTAKAAAEAAAPVSAPHEVKPSEDDVDNSALATLSSMDTGEFVALMKANPKMAFALRSLVDQFSMIDDKVESVVSDAVEAVNAEFEPA